MNKLLRKSGLLIFLLANLFFQIIWCGVKLAYWILNPWVTLQAGVIEFPLTTDNDVAITLLAYAITLTPGTLTLDINKEKSILYLHTLFINHQDKVIADIKRHFEQPILGLWQ